MSEVIANRDILTHTDVGVMTITFNRLDKKNSITAAMYALMADALQQAETNVGVRVVVFQGHETVFSAGNDIADFNNIFVIFGFYLAGFLVKFSRRIKLSNFCIHIARFNLRVKISRFIFCTVKRFADVGKHSALWFFLDVGS